MCYQKGASQLETKDYTHRRTGCDDCIQSQDDDRGGETDLQTAIADCGIPTRLD
jgi:hypothetical protein